MFMDGLMNIVNALGYAAKMFDYSLRFLLSAIEYMPAIIGSAVIVFVAVYVVRFLLLKWGALCLIFLLWLKTLYLLLLVYLTNILFLLVAIMFLSFPWFLHFLLSALLFLTFGKEQKHDCYFLFTCYSFL